MRWIVAAPASAGFRGVVPELGMTDACEAGNAGRERIAVDDIAADQRAFIRRRRGSAEPSLLPQARAVVVNDA